MQASILDTELYQREILVGILGSQAFDGVTVRKSSWQVYATTDYSAQSRVGMRTFTALRRSKSWHSMRAGVRSLTNALLRESFLRLNSPLIQVHLNKLLTA
jgi:hypothetical protein